MKIQPLLIALTVVNLAILTFNLAHGSAAAVQDAAPVLRGRALEIVDDQGRVRASLSVLPASKRANGETGAETVLLRLITERGRPSVKLSASEQGAGMSLAGPTGTKQTYVVLKADETVTSLLLKNEDGREHVVKP